MITPYLPTLRCTFELLTPAFVGDGLGAAELRVPTIRGLLRHWLRAVDPEWSNTARPPRALAPAAGVGAWLRAVDPEWSNTERLLYGDTNRQGLALLSLEPSPAFEPWSWKREESALRAFDVRNDGPTPFLNGVRYLGYVFSLKGNEHRTAIPAGTRFTLRVAIPDRRRLRPARRTEAEAPDERDGRALLALLGSIWALGHFGGMGTRARRGFGSLALTEWQWSGPASAEMRACLDRLPLAHGRDANGFVGALRAGLGALREGLGVPTGEVPHLGPASGWAGARFALLEPGGRAPRGWEWAAPLQVAGLALQRFRTGPEAVDRRPAKQHVLWLNNYKDATPLQQAPGRAAFGLPLTFRYITPRDLSPKSFEVRPAFKEPHTHELAQRWPSQLRVRVVRVGGALVPLLVRMGGRGPLDTPPGGERKAVALAFAAGVEDSRRETPLKGGARNLLDAFFDQVSRGRPGWRAE